MINTLVSIFAATVLFAEWSNLGFVWRLVFALVVVLTFWRNLRARLASQVAEGIKTRENEA